MRRQGDQETTIDQVYLGDLVEAVEDQTRAIREQTQAFTESAQVPCRCGRLRGRAMMPNTPIVSRDLAQARADLDAATSSLRLYYTEHLQADAIERLAIAIDATVSAVTAVSSAVERLAELPACDGSHES